MPIPTNYDNLLLDRRCVAAYYHGTLENLLQEVHLAGHTEITLTDLTSRGEVMSDAWRVGDPDKTTCYLCDAHVEPGALCACYNTTMPKRHFNVNEPKLLARLAPYTIVETFICQECRSLGQVTAESALSSHQRNKRYKPRKFCADCYAKSHRFGKNDRKKVAPALLQQATESVVSGQA